MSEEKAASKEIPSEEQIKRLTKLQGVDAGVYVLSVFSENSSAYRKNRNVGINRRKKNF